MKNKGTRTAVIHMVNGTVVEAIVTGSRKEVALMLVNDVRRYSELLFDNSFETDRGSERIQVYDYDPE